jgi:hypothetical protein
MKTKAEKSHWTCNVRKVYSDGEEHITKGYTFTAFDGVKHMEAIKKKGSAYGTLFEYTNLVNLDEE